MPRSPHALLSREQLNRATLARQLLLEHASLDPVAAMERIGGLQAQEPASPYLALWSRLDDFDPRALDAAFRDRRAVKASLMRITLHVVSRDDYGHLLTALLPMLRGTERATRGGVPRPERIEELAAAAAVFAAEPRRSTDLRDFVAELAGDRQLDTTLWWWVRRHLPLVHVPADVPWSFPRRPVLTTPGSWLDDGRLDGGGAAAEAAATEAAAREHLLRRYLGAFGPAAVADAAAWSGLSGQAFRGAVAALDASGVLRRFSDERGRELLDLADAPRPPGDTPAPARLLGMWDSVLLAHRDRTRVIADEHRPVVTARNGDVLPTFLVDGRVAGLWWTVSDGTANRIVLEPFGRLEPSTRRELEDAAARLAGFVAPLEPSVYGRYRHSRARRGGADRRAACRVGHGRLLRS